MRRLLRRLSGDQRDAAAAEVSASFSDLEAGILERVRPYTLTSAERLIALMDATSYVVRRDIPGALVECGVWRGGSVLATIEVLLSRGVTDRDVYLYDTFEGMTRPSEADTSPFEKERSALASWTRSERQGRRPWEWAFRPEIFSLEQVRDVLEKTGYPPERIHFVVGPVEETLPAQVPDRIALLRLDTDWYESTKHELVHLYPLLSEKGVLIIDDYGHWDGARRAVDEYFASAAAPLLLSRVDYTARMGVKG
ncbi:MAG TPA: TylF/MycF/NovP-related O-methyltransferase [Acidimicrobiales bacterium]|nr:TylF/MycF/NovP-related O-methyltransferase [Acidimicrobiales bacterium]